MMCAGTKNVSCALRREPWCLQRIRLLSARDRFSRAATVKHGYGPETNMHAVTTMLPLFRCADWGSTKSLVTVHYAKIL